MFEQQQDIYLLADMLFHTQVPSLLDSSDALPHDTLPGMSQASLTFQLYVRYLGDTALTDVTMSLSAPAGLLLSQVCLCVLQNCWPPCCLHALLYAVGAMFETTDCAVVSRLPSAKGYILIACYCMSGVVSGLQLSNIDSLCTIAGHRIVA